MLHKTAHLIFVVPCIIITFTKYNQQVATFLNQFSSQDALHVQAVPLPIIRSTKLYIQRQVFDRPTLLPAAIVEEMELKSSADVEESELRSDSSTSADGSK